MILSMVGRIQKEVIAEHIDMLLSIGLGDLGKQDLNLARYTCLALQQLGMVKREKGYF